MSTSNTMAGDVEAPLQRTVALIDDHQTFADLLRRAIDDEPDLTCAGVAYSIDSGLDLIADRLPDVVVTDLRFVGDERDGITVVDEVTARHPGTVVVLLTGHADSLLMQRAALAGANCLVAKSGSLPDLLLAIRSADPDGLTVPPALLRSLATTDSKPDAALFAALSNRESDVLALLTLGMDATAIARELTISVHTARSHIKALLRKLGAHSQLEAVAKARRRGLIDV